MTIQAMGATKKNSSAPTRSPKETFETGLRKTVEWYLANGEWVQGVQSGAYREWVSTQYAKS